MFFAHVNNKNLRVNIRSIFLFVFALLFSCKLEINDSASECKCLAIKWDHLGFLSSSSLSVIHILIVQYNFNSFVALQMRTVVNQGFTVYLDVRNTGHHPLPQAEQVVNRIWRKLPHVEGLDRELGYQLDRLRVVVHHHKLAQLIIRL